VVLILAIAERPVLRASAFAAGFASLLIPLSVVGLILLRGARDSLDAGSPLFAWIDIGMGAALVVVTVVSLLRRGDVTEQERRLRGAPVAVYFGVGMAMMIGNLNTLAVAVSLLHEVAIADITSFERFLTLAIVDLIILLPLLVPIGLVALAPRTAERVLPKIRKGVDDYGFQVGVVVFTGIAIYLLIEGISHL
jgi:tellurite resistance protein TehA-like permease